MLYTMGTCSEHDFFFFFFCCPECSRVLPHFTSRKILNIPLAVAFLLAFFVSSVLHEVRPLTFTLVAKGAHASQRPSNIFVLMRSTL